MFRARLQTKTRGKNETLTELAQSVRKLTRQAYPTADSSLINTLSLDYFIDAIPDSDMRLRIREARPSNINQAEIHAVRLETHKIADKQRRVQIDNMNTSNSVQDAPVREINDEKSDDASNSALSKLTDSIKTLEKSTQKLASIMKQNAPKSNWNNNNNNNVTTGPRKNWNGYNPESQRGNGYNPQSFRGNGQNNFNVQRENRYHPNRPRGNWSNHNNGQRNNQSTNTQNNRNDNSIRQNCQNQSAPRGDNSAPSQEN